MEEVDRKKVAGLPAAERQAIMKNLIVSHDRLAEGREALARFHRPVIGGVADTGTVSVVIGDTRTGKTFAASCEPACKKDPVIGVIGVQKGPPW